MLTHPGLAPPTHPRPLLKHEDTHGSTHVVDDDPKRGRKVKEEEFVLLAAPYLVHAHHVPTRDCRPQVVAGAHLGDVDPVLVHPDRLHQHVDATAVGSDLRGGNGGLNWGGGLKDG